MHAHLYFALPRNSASKYHGQRLPIRSFNGNRVILQIKDVKGARDVDVDRSAINILARIPTGHDHTYS